MKQQTEISMNEQVVIGPTLSAWVSAKIVVIQTIGTNQMEVDITSMNFTLNINMFHAEPKNIDQDEVGYLFREYIDDLVIEKITARVDKNPTAYNWDEIDQS